MPSYSELRQRLALVQPDAREIGFGRHVIPYLTKLWLDDYDARASSDITTVEAGGFYYLFDFAFGRLIAAWGVSVGRHAADRDAGRMAGHPKAGGDLYHRGHAIPHRLGGGTDINLVPQLGSINIGRFRPLEKRAVNMPGALYFTYWTYATPTGKTAQMPNGVDQGLLIAGQAPQITTHGN